MIEEYSPFVQTILGTFLTYGLTALGSAMVFFFNGYKRTFLDGSLGFAAGVMTAATFWSLLLPALEIAEQMSDGNKFISLIPVLVGLFFGAGFVHLTDVLLPDTNFLEVYNQRKKELDPEKLEKQIEIFNTSNLSEQQLRHRQLSNKSVKPNETNTTRLKENDAKVKKAQFRKIVLLIIAVTVHNIPEGLAVGVGFGAIGKTKSATYQNARNLAIGIGIQNFPEGLAVSLPLYASGFSKIRSFYYGQLSGMVEPLAGLVGALAVSIAQSVLPYALSFAAGAMIYVVFENLMPEASAAGNTKLATWCCIIGFSVMMSLDVGLN